MSTNVFNPVAPELVVQNYFRLVQTIARRIKRRLPAHVDVEDLVQTGVIGLLEASGRYDSSRAVEFSSYANSRITGAILDELRKWDTCSRHDRRKAREAEEAKSRLRATAGEEPSREEIAEAVGLALAEYEEILQRLESGKQSPAHCADEQQNAPDEINELPCDDDSPFDSFCKGEDMRMLEAHIKQLKPRHQEVLRLYYFKDLSLKEIGRRLGVGEARVCQIHKQGLTELRRTMNRKRVSAPMVSTMVQ
jgi:RNA polymerase sigma factor for flagellar operon FliA